MQVQSNKDDYENILKVFGFCEQKLIIIYLHNYFFRLEDLVEKQRAELIELRQQTGSANTTSTSGRGSLTPENAHDSTSTPQVSYTPSSGRGTALCHRGTDPLYEWPERTGTSTCTRSTSPLSFPDLLDMTSLVEYRENLASQELEEKTFAVVGIEVF